MSESVTVPERASSPAPEPITFTVKANNDTKYSLSLPSATTIGDVKTKLAELSEVPVDRQRLIYSGRVMKNDGTLETYNVKSGNTVHMVKGAVSNAQPNPSAPAANAVPRNLASGSGNNPLAGLTGARYAGHVQLPSADLFGPDGGMGPPPDPEMIAQAMSNPAFQAQMNDMLQNPQLIDYIIASNPILQQMGPSARQLMQSDLFRRMLTDPEHIRNMSRFGPGMGGPPAFPAPGQVDGPSTPAGQPPAAEGQPQPSANNPFASLFGSAPPPHDLNPLFNMFPMPFPPTTPGQPGSPNQPVSSNPPASPGQPGSSTGGTGEQQPIPVFGQSGNPFLNTTALQQLMQMYPTASPPAGGVSPNPFAHLLSPAGPGAFPASPPVDNRPPEERYADQLRQLNDMGFFDFDRNVEALRRSGGSVQGAINQLLGV